MLAGNGDTRRACPELAEGSAHPFDLHAYGDGE